MRKKSNKSNKIINTAVAAKHSASTRASGSVKKKSNYDSLDRNTYERELERLQGELVKLQFWLQSSGHKIIVIFEGRDTAGKGGIIKRITDRVSPRIFRAVALPAPSDRERSQLYLQRYVEQFPAGGECVLFDRSWYNRVGVERVMGFCTEQEARRFLEQVPLFERAIIDGGIQLIKYWLEISMEEQTRRFHARINDPRKTWKLSPMDLESHRRWYDYSRARDDAFLASDTSWAPWYVIDADDKRRARLNCISHFLSLIPYKVSTWKKPKLPKRQGRGDYLEPTYSHRYVPRRF